MKMRIRSKSGPDLKGRYPLKKASQFKKLLKSLLGWWKHQKHPYTPRAEALNQGWNHDHGLHQGVVGVERQDIGSIGV